MAILRGEPRSFLPLLPGDPGVYIFRDGNEAVLYVGKGVSLKSRVRNYFGSGRSLTARIRLMVGKIESVETIVTDSEVEALILEANLIKEHRPPYNILLRDDKQYPYLKLGGGQYPRLILVRSPNFREEKARYFGPYTSVGTLRENIKTLRCIFPLRTCSDAKMGTVRRPCLDHHIGRCLAPCLPGTDPALYASAVADMATFLEGKSDSILRDLRSKMRTQAANLEFEGAAQTRDRLTALEKVIQTQKMASTDQKDRDVVAIAREGEEAEAQVFTIREGKLVGRNSLPLVGTSLCPDAEIAAAFLQQYYATASSIPPQILMEAAPAGKETILAWLGQKRGGKVNIILPRRGDKRDLLELVCRNARLSLAERKALDNRPAMQDLALNLNLPSLPARIEGFDISNWGGKEAVGSQVVFLDGRPAKEEYRRFRIKSGDTPDDFRMLAECLSRCYRSRLREDGTMPDLIMVDGGRGQVSAAATALDELGLGHIPLIGLAKKEELVYQRNDPKPLRLPPSPLRILQALRDEAHRFAIQYHRNLRRRSTLASPLEEIPGIGPRRKKALLLSFPAPAALAAATIKELAAVPGMTSETAQRVYEHFHKEKD